MRDLAVNNVDLVHAFFKSVQGALNFGDHSAGDNFSLDHPLNAVCIDLLDQFTISLKDSAHISHQDHLVCFEMLSNCGGGAVRINIKGLASPANADRRQDRNITFLHPFI